MPDSLITDDLRRRLGRQLVKPATLVAEKGAIARFCRAIGDRGKTGSGDILAPPGFISQLMLWDGEIQAALADIATPAPHMFAGGTDIEYLNPVRAGDAITGTARLVEAYEREGKTGRVLFLVTQSEYTNQDGLLVARETSTAIRY